MLEFSFLNSSLIRSKIKTFASTAIPTVKITPAIPGNVKVASNNVKMPINIKRFEINDILAIIPKSLYLNDINKTTKRKPIIKETTPASIESFPKSGPTVLSSTTFNGVGKAPDLNNNAKSVAV